MGPSDTSVEGLPGVVVLGCGGIGLAVAVALASAGRSVLGVDIDAALVERLRAGQLDVLEDGLEAPFHDALASGALQFTAELEQVEGPRAFILAVPTPADEQGFDPRPLGAAMSAVAFAAAADDLVCVRSTVPIGATRALAASASHLSFAACPDRSIAGAAYLEQFTTPHLIGGLDDDAGERAAALFGVLGSVVRVPDPETAEAIKLFANIERDVTFALANQFAGLCEAASIDMDQVRRAGAEGFPRFRLARPGPVGGPCLTKDLQVLAASPALARAPMELLHAARRLNAGTVPALAARILADLGEGDSVAILGLAFKGTPPTRDVRQGFGGLLAEALKAARPGLLVRTWDPVLDPDPQARIAAVTGARIAVLANDHPALARINDLAPLMARGAVVYDATGLLAGFGEGPAGLTIRRVGDGRAGALPAK